MEAVKTKGKAMNGMLTVELPKEFNEKTVEIVMLSESASFFDKTSKDERRTE